MRVAFVIDQSKCIGCHACSLACKAEHEVPLGSYRTWVKYVEKGLFPEVHRTFSVLRCNHCEAAPCVEICPVTALYYRDDGIVDFDREVCIGCKACMQACPYDALYVHPEKGTAEKCNFCAHRVEIGLEPPCATVCPTESILVGDLDNRSSRVARLVATHKVDVRKPEKGTRPKVFYIQGDPRALTPGAAPHATSYLWADRQEVMGGPKASLADAEALASAAMSGEADFFTGVWAGLTPARTVYDVGHVQAPWGWKVSAYLWTKSISVGAFLLVALAPWLRIAGERFVTVGGPLVSLFFLAVTSVLLIADLKRPERFWTILARPNWSSWLARGAFILTGFGLLATVWTAVALLGMSEESTWQRAAFAILRWPLVALAAGTASYSGYLFAQAKGRDFWQSSLLPIHLAVQAMAAGSAALALLASFGGTSPTGLRHLLATALAGHLAFIAFGEVTVAHSTRDAAAAVHAITGGKLAGWFWGSIALVALAIAIALTGSSSAMWPGLLGGGAALLGLLAYEHAWNQAGQSVPMS